MVSSPNIQFMPPESWETFEEMIRDLYRDKWKDENIQLNGRRGQSQNGVDIYGHKNGASGTSGVQNKKKKLYPKAKLTSSEIKKELLEAMMFEPKLVDYEIITTTPRDKELQKEVRLINDEQRAKGELEVQVVFWEDIADMLLQNEKVARKYYSSSYSIDDVNEKRVEKDIDKAKALLDSLSLESAEQKSNELRKEEWDSIGDRLRFRLLTNLANIAVRKNKIDEAADLFTEAYHYNPSDEKAITNLAWAYNIRENYTESIAILEPLVKKSPGNDNAWTNLMAAHPEFSLDDSIKFIPSHLHKKFSIGISLTEKALSEEKFEEAKTFITSCIDNAENLLSTHNAHIMLGDILKNQANTKGDLVSLSQLTEESRQFLVESLVHMRQAWDIVKNTEAAQFFTYAGVQAMHMARFLGDMDTALIIADEILSVTSDEGDAHIMLGIAAGKNYKEAIKHFQAGYSTGAANAGMMLAEAYEDSSEPLKAVEVLNELYLKMDRDNTLRRHVVQLLSSSQQRLGLFQDALKTADDFLLDNKDDVMMIVQKAYVLKALEGEDRFKEELMFAFSKVDGAHPVDLNMLGDAFFGADMFTEARDVYAKLVNEDVDSDLHRRLINCSYRLGDNKEALRLATNLIAKFGPLPYVSELQSHILEGIDDLAGAKRTCVEFLALNPGDVSMQLRLALINQKLEEYDELDKFLTDFNDFEQLTSANDILPFVQLLQVRGFAEKARELLYDYRERFMQDSDAHVRYVGYFMMNERDSTPFDVKKVEVFTEVTVKNDSGEIKYFISSQDTDVTKRILNISESIAKSLIGKKVGDKVKLGSTDEPYRITAIKNKYIVALHESMEILSNYFPDNSAIKRITFDESKPEESIEKLLKTVDARKKAIEMIEKAYADSKVTIGAFAKQVGKGVVEIFYTLQGRGLKSKINVFNEDVSVLVDASAISEGTKLILDATAIISIMELGIGEKVVAEYGKFGISRATLSEFEQHLATLSSVGDDGYSTMSSDSGKLVLENITKEVIDIKIDLMNTIIEFIKFNAEILPVTKALDFKAERIAELNDILGESSASSMLLASEDGRTFYSDDFILRKIAESEFKVSGLWTQPLLMDLRDKGRTTAKEYNTAIIELVRRNYSYTSFDNTVLVTAAEESNWELEEPLTSMLNNFSDPILSGESIATIACLFTISLWKYSKASTIERDAIFSCVIDNLSKREDSAEVMGIFVGGIGRVSKLLPEETTEILALIKTLQDD